MILQFEDWRLIREDHKRRFQKVLQDLVDFTQCSCHCTDFEYKPELAVSNWMSAVEYKRGYARVHGLRLAIRYIINSHISQHVLYTPPLTVDQLLLRGSIISKWPIHHVNRWGSF